MSDTAHSDELFPIRTVSTLTGVNPVTLRAWERRYGIVQPQRTPKGHRLYSVEDVERIHRVLGLLDRGISIGQVRQLLEASAAEEEAAPARGPWDNYLDRMVAAIARYDEAAMNLIYNEALALYPIGVVTRELIVPLLHELGRRWETGEGTVAQEHFFSVFMRHKLGARFHHLLTHARGPKLLCACLPGEQHELGLMLFCLEALDLGFRVVLLGANTPLEELPQALRRSFSDAVVLAGTGCRSETDAELSAQLRRLVQQVAVPVVVGGRVSTRLSEEIQRTGAIPLGQEIQPGLRRLGEVLNYSRPLSDPEA